MFSTGCHDRIIGPPARRATRLIALRARKAYGSFRRVRVALSGCARTRCRSSVVEHPLGKGEVECSIHSGSTTEAYKSLASDAGPETQLAVPDRTEPKPEASTGGESVDFVLVWFRPNIPQGHFNTRCPRMGLATRNLQTNRE